MCRIVVWGFVLLYGLALTVALVGTKGLFGMPPDGLAAVYLILLGQPWAMLAGGLPAPFGMWGAVAAPAINLLLLFWLCRRAKRRST